MRAVKIITGVVTIIFLFSVGALITSKFLLKTDYWKCKDGQWIQKGNPSDPMPTKECLVDEKKGFFNNDSEENRPLSLSDGLVAYWKMDEDSWNGKSGEIVDSSGNKNHGIAMNGDNTSSTTEFSISGKFDGIDDYLDFTSDRFSNIFTDNDNFTISAWIKLDSLPVEHNTIVGQSFGHSMVFGVTPFGKLYLNMDDTRANSVKSNNSLSIDNWHHVVVTHSGAKNDYMANFYIDGQFDNKGRSYDGDGVSASSGEMYIGWQSRADVGANSYFSGQIKEVRIYRRLLLEEEIKNLYELISESASILEINKGSITKESDDMKVTNNEKESVNEGEEVDNKTPSIDN
jgi:cytochrome c1